MTDEPTDDEIIEHDSLEIDDDGHVDGSARTIQTDDGYDVTAGVFSYEYERDGEVKMNHVPSVVVADEDGAIVEEPHVPDSADPEKAIAMAKDTMLYTRRHLDQYVD